VPIIKTSACIGVRIHGFENSQTELVTGASSPGGARLRPASEPPALPPLPLRVDGAVPMVDCGCVPGGCGWIGAVRSAQAEPVQQAHGCGRLPLATARSLDTAIIEVFCNNTQRLACKRHHDGAQPFGIRIGSDPVRDRLFAIAQLFSAWVGK